MRDRNTQTDMFKDVTFIVAQDANRLNTRQIDVPSRQQLQRLRNGDEVRLRTSGKYCWALVTARDGDALLGRVLEAVEDSPLLQNDSVAFGTCHIYEVRPGPKPAAPLPDWLLAKPPAGHVYYLLRAKWPSLLASADVQTDGYVNMQLVRLYDQPDDAATDLAKLLDGGRRWLTDNYLKTHK